MQSRLGTLTPEQAAAVDALSRGLMNKFLHPPMQALKQAARDGDLARVEAIRETYGLEAELPILPMRIEVEADKADLGADLDVDLLDIEPRISEPEITEKVGL
jgi:glutamyl-tRNA reductase